jgi:CTP-dependent riboflavin kinase
MSISEFTNDNFRVLAYLYNNMDASRLVKITQQEVSDALGISRVTINKIFKQLKSGDYITQDSTKVGRYYLTESGINIVKALQVSKKKEQG